jgi:hypothetical protein
MSLRRMTNWGASSMIEGQEGDGAGGDLVRAEGAAKATKEVFLGFMRAVMARFGMKLPERERQSRPGISAETIYAHIKHTWSTHSRGTKSWALRRRTDVTLGINWRQCQVQDGIWHNFLSNAPVWIMEGPRTSSLPSAKIAQLLSEQHRPAHGFRQGKVIWFHENLWFGLNGNQKWQTLSTNAKRPHFNEAKCKSLRTILKQGDVHGGGAFCGSRWSQTAIVSVTDISRELINRKKWNISSKNDH